MSQDAPLPSGPSETIASPLGSSTLPMALQRGPPGSLPCPSTGTSCQILQGSQLEGLWQNVHMWAVQKEYLKPGLNGVCLQEHLEVCLDCPQCEDELFRPFKVLSP